MASGYIDLPVEGGSGGVTSLNTLTGAVVLVAGAGITLTPAGNNITIAAPGGAGTVTSVAMTVPSFLSVAGSPITTAGTLAVTLSGTALPMVNGGTGLTSGTSGGVLYFSSTTTLASSALLTANAIVLGGGAGTAPISLGSLGTTTTVLHGNAAGAPTFAAVSLTADVSGTLPIANGGTGQTTANAAFNALSPMTTLGDTIYGGASGVATRLAGNITTAKQFLSQTGDGANSAAPAWATPAFTDITGTLAVGSGGTGLTSGTSGGVLYFSGTTTLASSALLTANAIVLGGGAGTAPISLASLGTTTTVLHGNAAGAPTFGAVALATDVSGTLPVGSGGTGTTGGNFLIAAFGITIDGGGSVITTGVKGFVSIPFACTINSWDIFADVSGSIVVDVWKDTYANFPPTVADTIAGSEKPTLSSAQKNQDLTLSTWTTAITAGDVIAFNVDSATTVTRVNLIIKVTKT